MGTKNEEKKLGAPALDNNAGNVVFGDNNTSLNLVMMRDKPIRGAGFIKTVLKRKNYNEVKNLNFWQQAVQGVLKYSMKFVNVLCF